MASSSTPEYTPSYIDSLYDIELVNGNLFPQTEPSYDINKSYIETFTDQRGFMQCISIFPSLDKRGSKLVLLYFHGNSCDIGDCTKRMRLLSIWLSCTVIGIEYAGYGCSTGEKTQESIIYKCLDTINYLREIKQIPYSRMVLYGHSIGCAIVMKLNSIFKGTFAGIILMAPFINVKKVAEHHRLPSSFAILEQILSNLKEVSNMKKEQFLMIIHGKKDDIIPHSHSIKLFQECPLPSDHKFLHLQDNATHNVFDKEALHWVCLLPFFRTCEEKIFKPTFCLLKITVKKQSKKEPLHRKLRQKQQDAWLSSDGSSCSFDLMMDENANYKRGLSAIASFLNQS